MVTTRTIPYAEFHVVAVRVYDPALMAELEQHGVKVTGRSGPWVSLLLWLLAAALMLFYWRRTQRSLSPAAS